MILYKNVPGKNSPLIVENEWEQSMFTTMEKKLDMILKTLLATFNMQMHRKKRPRNLNSERCFVQGLEKIGAFLPNFCISRVYFTETFFSDFLI